jgi:hypothetical protein
MCPFFLFAHLRGQVGVLPTPGPWEPYVADIVVSCRITMDSTLLSAVQQIATRVLQAHAGLEPVMNSAQPTLASTHLTMFQ